MQRAEDLKKQILVVEDEALIASDIQSRLERLGYPAPAIARSGEEALRFARSTPFDLVLMDIRLNGGMDGITTARALKDELETPVVFMSSCSDRETVNRAKFSDPLGYIQKPIRDGDLHSVVQISIYRHAMERRLRTSEAWLSTTLRCVGEAIIATNTAGEIVFMNPVAEHLTGCSGNEAYGCLLMDVLGLFEESNCQPAKNPIFDLFAGESRSYTLTSKMGEQTVVEVQCFENRSEDDVLGSIVVMRDISSRREIEARLTQSQRMEAIAGMAGGLAHNFNNRLMVIQGYATELSARLQGEDKEQALEIVKAAEVAASLTSQLLTLSRRKVGRPEVLDVNEVICETQPMISHSLGKARTLVTELAGTPGFIRGDRDQFKQVLLHLAVNARETMRPGGELRIESSALEVDSDSPAARMHRPGLYVRLRVTDTGTGMDSIALSRIFEPVFTARKPGFGTGLGLSLVHSIIVQSGGYISANSEIGQGTSFEILLPCAGPFQERTRLSEAPSPAAEAPHATVLLVEDEESVRRLIHLYLKRQGYRLLEAECAEEAERIARAFEEPIHILVTDVMMSGMTGPELAERLMPGRPDMKVLFVSGYTHDTLADRGPWKRELNLLSKPFTPSELIQRIQVLMRPGIPA